ncbi:ataxin-3-like protein [Papio anubis]|uniref:ataxin-3-like protein n=1 Tax=Papio anubis TaxID=9555 RepID=UPI0012ADD805|nr:ataxin-3-like protein [Papio anubis]XP_031516388.1 ataxin-3-like protein [Papio anubis]
MDFIFHEKQEGFLCAQHCLNNLLQGEYFSPVELASIAHQLDEEERMRMAEGGVTSEDYRAFLQQPSENMDDSGFFSIQGDLPDCEADQLLQIISVEEMDRPKLNGKKLAKEKDHRVYKTILEKVSEESDESGTSDQEEQDFQRALELSRQETNKEDEDLRRAIELSMQGSSRNTSQDLPKTSCGTPASEEPKKIKDYFEKHQQEQKQQQQQSDPPGHSSYLHERPTTSSRAIESDLSDDIKEDMVQAAVDTVLEIMRKNLKIKGEK